MLESLLHATFIKKKSYIDDSTHKLLMIPHTNIEIFYDSAQIVENDCASSTYDLIAILSVWSKQYRYELDGNDDTPTKHTICVHHINNIIQSNKTILWKY